MYRLYLKPACAALALNVLFAACATKITPVFIKAEDSYYESIVVHSIDDFEELVKKNKIDTVFYTDEYFIVEINSVFYSHISRGYKSFREYREGRLDKPERWSIFSPGYSN